MPARTEMYHARTGSVERERVLLKIGIISFYFNFPIYKRFDHPVFYCCTGYVVLLARRYYRGNCGFNKIKIENSRQLTMAEAKLKLEHDGQQPRTRKVGIARRRATTLSRARVVLYLRNLKGNVKN
jgi:hypothetical protein